MNKPAWKLINIIATGFIVTILFSIVLFWCRLYCSIQLNETMTWKSKTITISPSGLVPGEGLAQLQKPVRVTPSNEAGVSIEPNVLLSAVQSNMENYYPKLEAIGIIWPPVRVLLSNATIQDSDKEGYYLWYQDSKNFMHFNKRSGLINLRNEYKAREKNREEISHKSEFYAGPNGVSQTASASLGGFEEPIVNMGILRFGMCFYDKKLRQFYFVDFNEGKVTKGLELAQEDRREPIAMGHIEKNFSTSLYWKTPKIKDVNNEWIAQKLVLSDNERPNEEWDYHAWSDYTQRHIIVLDKSGKIYALDTNKWILKDAGYLPVPLSLFSEKVKNEPALPESLLDYDVVPVYILSGAQKERPRLWEAKDRKYLGMCVSTLSREGTALATVIFDANGTMIFRADTGEKALSSAEAIYGSGGESVWAVGEYLLENLQPLVFEIASYLCKDFIEASAGHRALFVLPNSFLGMLGRGNQFGFFEQQVLALIFMTPSLVLSVWLAGKVKKDARIIGLSSRAGKWWVAGTIAFGLPAYITYRITRPKETLVTCQNCGKMRRPDMEACHRCGSKWEVPELTPPNWRICD